MRLDLAFGFGALGLEADFAAGDGVSAFLEDHDHVECGAAARAGKQEFHRARGEVAATGLRGAVHDQGVVASGFCDERHAFAGPFHCAVHGVSKKREFAL